jgi:hypothetical protein
MGGGAMKRIFWAGCPACDRDFIVSWELRSGDIKLRCPFCAHRFLADDAARIDERY